MMTNINIYFYEAWSLSISAAAHWNSGLENLLKFITTLHLLHERVKQKGKCDANRITVRHHVCCRFKISTYLQNVSVRPFLWSSWTDVRKEAFVNEADEYSGDSMFCRLIPPL